jgi:hypothetical protein
MANASIVGYGCRQTMTVGNTPATGGQSEFLVQGGAAPGATVAIFKGSPVGMQTAAGGAGTLGFIMDQSAATMTDGVTGGATWTLAGGTNPSLGVFNGATFVDVTGKPSWTNGLAAAQTSAVDYNTGSNNITAFVIDNPNQEYVVKADDAITQAGFGLVTSYNINNWTASTNKDGQSIATLDIASPLATKMFSLVRSANDPENKDLSEAGANVIVTISKASALYN